MWLAGIFAAIMLLLSAGCHSSKPDTGVAPDAGATLTVENQGFSDMTIYVVSGTTGRVRLGQVTGNSTQSFPIPATWCVAAKSSGFWPGQWAARVVR